MKRIAFPLGLLLFLSFSVAATHADVIFATGTVSQPNEQAIDLTVGATGNTLYGTTDTTGWPVDIYSADDPLKVYAHGTSFGIQTDHGPGDPDTSVNDVTINVPGGTYQDLLGSVYGVFAENPYVSFTVYTTDSTTPWTWTFEGSRADDGNVDNYWSIYTTGGEQISSVTIDGKFYELRDLDMSGPAATTTPEPSSMMLLASGLLGAARLCKKKF